MTYWPLDVRGARLGLGERFVVKWIMHVRMQSSPQPVYNEGPEISYFQTGVSYWAGLRQRSSEIFISDHLVACYWDVLPESKNLRKKGPLWAPATAQLVTGSSFTCCVRNNNYFRSFRSGVIGNPTSPLFVTTVQNFLGFVVPACQII